MHKGSFTGGKLVGRMPWGGGNAKTLEFEMKIRKIAVVCISSVN